MSKKLFPGHKKYGTMGPHKKEVYDSIPARNKTIDKVYKPMSPTQVKDVEVYNPVTKKSKMVFKPGK